MAAQPQMPRNVSAHIGRCGNLKRLRCRRLLTSAKITPAQIPVEPIVAAHADGLFPLLVDPLLYRYLDQPPQSAEALSQLAALPAGAADRLREYLHGDYLILYTVATRGQRVHLLSIRHHRELSFQFSTLWAGPAANPER